MPDALPRSLLSLTRRLAARHETDATLLGRYTAEGDAAAFAELIRRHGPLVHGVCLRMLGQAHDADDAFQATFLVLARNARSVHRPGALSAWLYGTAVRVCRKARSRRPSPAPLPETAAVADDPFAEVAWKEVRGLLDEEVGRLPDALRAPLLLCYFDGLTRDEAARRLGWSRRTLMRRLEQARERLKRRLQRRGVATLGLGVAVLTPDALAVSVPRGLLKAAAGLGRGGPVSASVQALAAGSVAAKLFVTAAGLLLLVCAGGVGWTAFGPQAASEAESAIATQPALPMRADAPRMDIDGQPLPPGAVRRLGSRRFRIEGRSDFILPSPDGKCLLIHPQPWLSAYAAQGLMLLDADTGMRVRSFEDSRRVPKGQAYEAIRPAAFSPDGKKLYALGWHKSEEQGPRLYVWASIHNPCWRVVLVWDVATGKKTGEWELPAGGWVGASLIGVSASPDGRRVYVYGAVRIGSLFNRNARGTPGVHVLDATTGKVLQTWDDAGYVAGTIAGGKEVVTFRDGAAVTAHDAQTGKPVRTFPVDGRVSDVAISPDGKTVAAAAVSGHPDHPTACEVKLWDAATGRDIRRLTADAKLVHSATVRLACAADGKTLYLGAGSGHILRWNLADGKPLPHWPARGGSIADLHVRPGKSELVSAGKYDGTIFRWDAATGAARSATNAYVGRTAVARTPDGKEVAVWDATGRVEVWDIATGRLARTLRLPTDANRRLAFSPDGRALLDATGAGKIIVRDAVTGAATRTIAGTERLRGSDGWCTLAFRPDGRHLLASRDEVGTQAVPWPDGTAVWQSGDAVYAAYSPDGNRLATGNWNRPSHVRDAESGAIRAGLEGESLTSATFSPSGRWLVTTHLYGVWRVRDGKTGAVLKDGKEFQHSWSAAFSPTGWLLAVAGDKTVRVYETTSWQELTRFNGHDGTVSSVFFGPDDGTLVSASAEDGTALVWSLKPPSEREPPDPARLWADLAGDAPAAWRAVWSAARHPQVAVALFRDKWPPRKLAAAEQVRRLIADLDHQDFATREAAEAGLVKIGRVVEPELRKELTAKPSPEVKRRAERVLARWSSSAPAACPADEARELRAVWALKLAGTPAARKLLDAWATERVGTRLCEEAAVQQRP